MHHKATSFLFALVLCASPSFAQDQVPTEIRVEASPFLDVIYTKDGSVWKGVIVEQIPGQRFRIALKGGSVMVVKAGDVERIAKVKNPDYQGAGSGAPAPSQPAPQAPSQPSQQPEQTPPTTPATRPNPQAPAPTTGAYTPPTGTSSELPAPVAKSGGRFSLGIGLLFPNGDFGEGDVIETSFQAAVRVGKEIINGRVGFTPAARASLSYFRNKLDFANGDDYRFVSIGVGFDLRASLHMGRAAPYLSLGLGLEINTDNNDLIDNGVGVGLDIGLGVDVYTGPSNSVGVGLLIHPGFTAAGSADTTDVTFNDVTYWGLQLQGTFLN